MNRATLLAAPVCLFLAFAAGPASAAEGESAEAAKVSLRYQFQPGETVRWQVVHEATVKTTVSGTTQTAETLSRSVKVWKITNVDAEGNVTFEHSVEDVEMRQNLTGRREVRYSSKTDETPPPGFEKVAESIGVPLAAVTIDPQGNVLKREQKGEEGQGENAGQITLPLPEGPVAVGESWTEPNHVAIPRAGGVGVKMVQTQQKFTLEKLDDGVATIRVQTQVLTPVHDPAIEAQLIQRESNGTIRFDVERGRIVGQNMALDKQVIGFRGPTSKLDYATKFTEELLAPVAQTATRPDNEPSTN